MNPDPIEDRLARIEASMAALEARLAKLEREPPRARRVASPEPATPVTGIDYTLIGKSVLMIGGAYLLRALTELGVLNELAGVILAFVYAMTWIWIASRASRTVALFDAGTAALIAGSLTWEATARFHAITPPVASAMIVIASIVLLWVARRRADSAFLLIAAAMTGVTCIGLAIGTGGVLPPLIAVAILAILTAINRAWPSYVSLGLAFVSGGLAAPLIVLSGGATIAAVVLTVLTATMIVLALFQRDPLLLIAAGWTGLMASVLGIQPRALPIVWAAAALICAALARRQDWSAMAFQSAVWALAAAFACVASPTSLPIIAATSAISLVITRHARIVFLAIATATAILSAMVLLPESSPAIRTAIIALAAVVLSLFSIPEASVIARVLLAIGGLKLLIDDFRGGQATAIVIALTLYGGAIVIVARRRRQSVAV